MEGNLVYLVYYLNVNLIKIYLHNDIWCLTSGVDWCLTKYLGTVAYLAKLMHWISYVHLEITDSFIFMNLPLSFPMISIQLWTFCLWTDGEDVLWYTQELMLPIQVFSFTGLEPQRPDSAALICVVKIITLFLSGGFWSNIYLTSPLTLYETGKPFL